LRDWRRSARRRRQQRRRHVVWRADGLINNLLNLVGVKSFYQDIVKGAVIILAVLLVATKRETK
jgi:hypothetical protein